MTLTVCSNTTPSTTTTSTTGAEHLDHDDEHDRAAEHDHHRDVGPLTGRSGSDRFL